MPLRLTQSGYERLQRELEQLYLRRSELIAEVGATTAEGDLSENAGFEAAKRALEMVEVQILYIRQQLADAEIIEQNGEPEKAEVGVIITLQDLDTGEEIRYRIAESVEIDFSSPIKTATPKSLIGAGLLGKQIGDEVIIQTPTQTRRFQVLHLTWDSAEPLSYPDDGLVQNQRQSDERS